MLKSLNSIAPGCDTVTQGAVGLLVITCVMAMGARHYWGRALIQLTAAGVGIVWSLRLLVHPRLIPPFRNSKSRHGLIVLFGLLTLPLVPLPPVALEILSPSAFTISSQALPGWPARAPFDDLRRTLDLVPARLALAAQLPPAGAWRPLALVPHDTARTLSLGAAYVLVAALMAFYPWPDGGTGAVAAVLSVLIALGLIEALYGLFTASTGYNRMYWFECSGACMGTYGNRDHYAGLLEMIFPLTLARVAVWHTALRYEAGAMRHGPGSFRKRVYIDALAGTVGRLVSAAAIALLLLVAMAVSGSRSAFAATIASLLIMVRLLPRNTHSPSAIRRPQFLSLAVAALAILWLTYPQILGKLWGEDQLRPLMAADTFDIARHFPLFGIGLGNFASAFPFYRAQSVEVWQWGVSDAHNDYLQWTAEVGFPAAILSFILLAAFGRRVWRALRAAEDRTPEAMTRWGLATAVLALLLHSLTDFNLHIPANALVFAVLVGSLIRLTPLSDLANEPLNHSDNGSLSRSPNESILRPSTNPSGFPLSAFRFPLSLLNLGLWTLLLFCLIWGGFTWRQWDADAAYAAVYPDLGLRDLVAAPAQPDGAEALRLVRRAAALTPSAPDFQAALGERLVTRALDADTPLSEADGLLDTAIIAYIRSLWAAALQPRTMLGLVAAAEPIYQPDPGSEPGVLYDLVGRAAALAPYDRGFQSAVAQWHKAK